MAQEIASGAYTMSNVINIWTHATIHGVSFTVDDLALEFDVWIIFEDFGWWNFFDTGECDVDYEVTMAFLAKVYYFDFKSFFFENFGTTMEQLGDEGRLWIMSRTAGWHPVIDSETGEQEIDSTTGSKAWVSFFHFVNWLTRIFH